MNFFSNLLDQNGVGSSADLEWDETQFASPQEDWFGLMMVNLTAEWTQIEDLWCLHWLLQKIRLKYDRLKYSRSKYDRYKKNQPLENIISYKI